MVRGDLNASREGDNAVAYLEQIVVVASFGHFCFSLFKDGEGRCQKVLIGVWGPIFRVGPYMMTAALPGPSP